MPLAQCPWTPHESAEVPHCLPVAEPVAQALEFVLVPWRVVNAQVVEHGGRQVGRRYLAVPDVAGVTGGRAVDLPAGHAAAGQQGGEGVRPVVAAAALRIAALGE